MHQKYISIIDGNMIDRKQLNRSSVTPDTDAFTIIVRIPAGTHKALRIRVAEQDTSIQKWVEQLIERELGLERASHSLKGPEDDNTPGVCNETPFGRPRTIQP